MWLDWWTKVSSLDSLSNFMFCSFILLIFRTNSGPHTLVRNEMLCRKFAGCLFLFCSFIQMLCAWPRWGRVSFHALRSQGTLRRRDRQLHLLLLRRLPGFQLWNWCAIRLCLRMCSPSLCRGFQPVHILFSSSDSSTLREPKRRLPALLQGGSRKHWMLMCWRIFPGYWWQILWI